MNGKKIRVGILGTSSFARQWMIPAFRQLSTLYDLIGVGSRNFKKSVTFSQELNLELAGDYLDIVSSSKIDLVYIPLPNSLHFEWIEASLKSGKHVLVEKSMTCSYEETKYLNELASERGLVLVENFHFRFHPQLKEIKSIINSGVIGEIRVIKSYFGFPPFPNKTNIRYQQKLGGGALLDAGAYPLKLSQLLLGLGLRCEATSLTYSEKFGVDIHGGGMLKQIGGNKYSFISFGFHNAYQCSLEIWGSNGFLNTNRIYTAKPDFEVEINLQIGNSLKVINVPTSSSYLSILKYIFNLIQENDVSTKSIEYQQNINQAKLLEEFKNCSSILYE